MRAVEFRDSTGTAGIKRAYDSMRCRQVYMTLLNSVNRQLIFTWKLFALGAGIFCGYAAIAHFHDHPIFGVMYYVFLINSVLIYTQMYEKAFQVSAQLEGVKRLMKRRGINYGSQVQRKLLVRRINSIPLVGVKVGDFHVMERTSTPVFLHYIVTNIVNMLVAYR